MYNLPSVTAGMTKTQIKIVAESSINELLNNGRILEAAEALTVMENFIKEVRSSKEFTDYVREEVSKNGKTITNSSGAKIELAETGVKYDFTNCGDIILQELNHAAEVIETHIAERKDFLKTCTIKGTTLLHEETGEAYTVYPPTKTSNSSYKITLRK
jgi:predicted RNA-binding Zn-ribbon protein involved in translation (DUF1610 family)